MCITYESVYEFAETREITVPLIKVAKEYERVHFIGHALYKPDVTKEMLMPYAGRIREEIEAKTGYQTFLVDIAVKQWPPIMTDVDFIFDVPVVTSFSRTRVELKEKFSPIDPVTATIIIGIIVAAILFLVFMFWTYWSEKHKIYYCDQESPPSQFTGWKEYIAHLAEKHPKKYEAIKESEANDWWTAIAKLPEMVKWAVGGLVVVTAVSLVASLIPKRRE